MMYTPTQITNLIGCCLLFEGEEVFLSQTDDKWILRFQKGSSQIDFKSLLLFLNRIKLYLTDEDDTPLVTVQEFLKYHSFTPDS